ncbi:regulator SirB [Massilia sp. KIM]|nr:regulator SirB [Massilia sp. KIM]
MDYYALKHVHMSFAFLSGALFLGRGLWTLAGAAPPQRRWARIAPHLIDTLLLASAIGLAVWSSQYPFAAPWLTAKVLALAAYILLGSVALKRGRSARTRALAFVAALACFGYIVAVALAKHPLPF